MNRIKNTLEEVGASSPRSQNWLSLTSVTAGVSAQRHPRLSGSRARCLPQSRRWRFLVFAQKYVWLNDSPATVVGRDQESLISVIYFV